MTDFSKRLDDLVTQGQEKSKQAQEHAEKYSLATEKMQKAASELISTSEEKLKSIKARIYSEAPRRHANDVMMAITLAIPEDISRGESSSSPRDINYKLSVIGKPMENEVRIGWARVAGIDDSTKITTDFDNILQHLENTVLDIIKHALRIEQ